MSLRLIDYVALTVGAAVGAASDPGILGSDGGRTLATFLGLFAASILPTITLLVNGMTASGRSVLKLQQLMAEIEVAIDALLAIFGLVLLAVAGLVSLSIATPALLLKIPFADEVLPRAGQALVAASTAVLIARAGQLPSILRRTLTMRADIAVDEARRKVDEKGPSADAVRKGFATRPGFGRSIDWEAPAREN